MNVSDNAKLDSRLLASIIRRNGKIQMALARIKTLAYIQVATAELEKACSNDSEGRRLHYFPWTLMGMDLNTFDRYTDSWVKQARMRNSQWHDV